MEPVSCGPYRLLEQLAIGGMAEIFRAAPATGAPEGLPDRIVVKRLLAKHASNPDFIELFEREGGLVRRLRHDNIVHVFDVGAEDDQHYMAMEYVAGCDLRLVLSRASDRESLPPFALAARIVAAVADALGYAHEAKDDDGWPLKLVHRDVCPHNILVAWDGRVKLADFGIARAADRAAGVRAGQLSGRTGYLSPEQVQGLEVDARSDVFSLGVVLYEMTVGQRLFKKPSQIETLSAVTEARVPSPSFARPDFPPALETIVYKALARSPDERYASAEDLAGDLRSFTDETGEDVSADALAAWMRELFPDESSDDVAVAVSTAAATTPQAALVPAPDGADLDEEDEVSTALTDAETLAAAAAEAEGEGDDGAGDEAPDHAAGDDQDAPEEPLDQRALTPMVEVSGADNSELGSDDDEGVTAPASRALDGAPQDERDPDDVTPEATVVPTAAGLEAAAEANGRTRSRPPRGTRPRAKSHTHAIPKIAGDNPQDVYLSLDVGKRQVRGYLGVAGAVAAIGLVVAIWYFAGMGNAEQERVFEEARVAAEAIQEVPRDQPKPPAADGTIVVRSEPADAVVFVDWMPWGEGTPTRVPVVSGVTHHLRVEASGHRPYEEVVNVPKQGAVERSVTLAARTAPEDEIEPPPPPEGEAAPEPAPRKRPKKRKENPVTGKALLVSEPAGATIWMGGVEVGQTPAKLQGLFADQTHVAVLKQTGLTPHVVVFRVYAGLESGVRVELSRSDLDLLRRDLYVQSEPEGAEVLVDGRSVGPAPAYQRLLRGVRHDLVVRAPGFEPFETIAATDQATLTVRATLEREKERFGFVSIKSTTKARVYVGSQEIGTTPIKRHRLPSGSHVIVLDTDTHRGQLSVKVGPEESLAYSVWWDDQGGLHTD